MKGLGIITQAAAVGEVKKDARLVAEAIQRLIMTRPYERPRSPVGSNVHEVLFEPNDFTAASLIGYYINEVLGLYENRVEVDQIVARNLGDNVMRIEVTFRLKADATQTVTVGFNVQ